MLNCVEHTHLCRNLLIIWSILLNFFGLWSRTGHFLYVAMRLNCRCICDLVEILFFNWSRWKRCKPLSVFCMGIKSIYKKNSKERNSCDHQTVTPFISMITDSWRPIMSSLVKIRLKMQPKMFTNNKFSHKLPICRAWYSFWKQILLGSKWAISAQIQQNLAQIQQI